LVALIILTSTAMPETLDPKTLSAYPKMIHTQVTSWIKSAAEKMPEAEYAYKPDAAARSFGEILGHIANANYRFCAPLLGEDHPSTDIEKTKTTKAELTSALRDAFAYADRAYAELNEETATGIVKSYGKDTNRLSVLWFNAAHNLEHYGNLAVYLRTKSI